MKRLENLYREYAGTAASDVSLLPLSGSARKYYRMSGGGGSIIGVIGTNTDENKAFITISGQFRKKGLNAPEVYGTSPDGMAYIQQDLGDDQLFGLLKPSVDSGVYDETSLGLLRRTMEALPSIQYLVGDGLDWNVCFPDKAFNERMVNFDLNYFKYDFLKFTGLEFNEIRLQDDFDRLREDSLEGIGNTFMCRDFQARNVMVCGGEPWFIDFQGGRRGPVQYDLASFLWNAGTHFSAEMRASLEKVYLDALREYQKVSEDEFRERYRMITLVRLLQEMGAYGFRGIFERKQIFLDCLAPAKRCLHELTEQPFGRYPYLTSVLRRIADEWEPSI